MIRRATRVLLLGGVALLGLVNHSSLITSAASDSPSPERIESGITLAAIERQVVEIYQRASPSVVQVTTVGTAKSKKPIKIGSGFVWDSAGNIVTNEHVIDGGATILVWLASGEALEAEVTGANRDYDLAVIRLKQARELPPPIPLGTSGNLKVGQFAYAIGSPFALDQTLTAGVIGALNRKLPTNKDKPIANIIQTDAAIYPGNSGGPLLDASGRLIGVNSISYFAEKTHGALGFAIPVDLVSQIVPELIRVGRTAAKSR